MPRHTLVALNTLASIATVERVNPVDAERTNHIGADHVRSNDAPRRSTRISKRKETADAASVTLHYSRQVGAERSNPDPVHADELELLGSRSSFFLGK